MTPWEVIEEALAHRRPRRGPKWLADELHEKIQVVSNWKARGVPARRYRDIATVLGLTIDQIEGIEPLPWQANGAQSQGLLPDVAEVAWTINSMPEKWRKWTMDRVKEAIDAAREAMDLNPGQVNAVVVAPDLAESSGRKKANGR